MQLNVAVISDVVCPWCFIGKRRLEKGIQLFLQQTDDRHASVNVRWLPFQLNPGLPPDGISREDYLRQKFGARAGEIYARVSEAAATVDLPLAFERIQVQPNTLNAHRLIHYAERFDRQDAMVEQLFRGYFFDGANLCDLAKLADIAAGVGCDRDKTLDYLRGVDDREDIDAADQRFREMGLSGVPFFVFANKFGVSGAQEPENLARAMLRAHTESRSTPPVDVPA
jgi:predicted DsbA family dithiol-disulfide isomerase